MRNALRVLFLHLFTGRFLRLPGNESDQEGTIVILDSLFGDDLDLLFTKNFHTGYWTGKTSPFRNK